jgi:hypothetical protein
MWLKSFSLYSRKKVGIMSNKLNRRGFLKKSALASAVTVAGLSLDEQTALAKTSSNETAEATKSSNSDLEMGMIKNVKISKLIIGSNLFGGGAHSRDLRYVRDLLDHYFTHEKVMDTLQLCEENGINTSIGGAGVNEYNKERGGNLQFIAQLSPDLDEVREAIDDGAIGAFIWGKRADELVKAGRMEKIVEFVDFVKQNGLIAGVGGHSKNVPIACEKAGIDVDFYFKTIHHDNYFSATPKDQRVEYAADSRHPTYHDNMWSLFPEITIEFMKTVEKPWIAYKVLAAGAIHPREGFRYAFENGADFICAGMLDFQIKEDVQITKDILAELKEKGRERPWIA